MSIRKSSWRKTRRKTLTLLEVIIGIMLMTLCTGIIGVKAFALIEQTKFEKQHQMIVTHLRTIRELALTRQMDIEVTFENTPAGLLLVTREEGRIILKKMFTAFLLRDREEVALVCYGRGAVMAPKKLHLIGKKKELDLSLYSLFDYSEN